MIIFTGLGLSPVSAYASTIDTLTATANVPVTGNPGNASGPPDHVPPVNPPIDTPAFYNGLVNAPTTMPPSVPSYTLPGSNFGRTAVPVPASIWLLGSGLLGLIGIAKRRQAS
jgi:hypothetical protein